MNGLGEDFAGKVTVLRLDATVEMNAKLQSQWGLIGHPTFAVLDADEKLLFTFFGPQQETTLREALGVVAEK